MLPHTPAAILLAGVFVRFLVHFCKRNLRIRKIAPMIRRWIVPVFFVSGILANSIDAAVLYHQAQNESVSRLMFDAARIARQENRSIFLYNPPERLEGSANFHLHKNLPEYSDYLQEPQKPELWIIRCEDLNIGEPYGDKHWLLRMPECFSALLEKFPDREIADD